MSMETRGHSPRIPNAVRRVGAALLFMVAISGATAEAASAQPANSGVGPARALTKNVETKTIEETQVKTRSDNLGCGDPPITAPIVTQERSMLCHINAVRTVKLVENPALDVAAEEKIGEIIGCRSFSHTPCIEEDPGEGPFDNLEKPPEPWHVAENLAWGQRDFGSVPAMFQAWHQSAEHWPNIMNEQFTEIGIAARHVPSVVLDGTKYDNVLIWSTEFLGHY